MNVQARLQDDLIESEHEGPPDDKGLHASVFDLWNVLRIRFRMFAAATGVLFAVIVLAAILAPRYYTGTARVMVDPRQNNVANLQQVLSGLTTDQIGRAHV